MASTCSSSNSRLRSVKQRLLGCRKRRRCSDGGVELAYLARQGRRSGLGRAAAGIGALHLVEECLQLDFHVFEPRTDDRRHRAGLLGFPVPARPGPGAGGRW